MVPETPIAPVAPKAERKVVESGTSPYKYIGPDYTDALYRGSDVFRPRLFSDAQIEQFLADNDWGKAWFVKA
jgi:hypothetical protein